MAMTCGAQAMETTVADFGTTPAGEAVRIVTLAAADGVRARIITWGAAIQSVEAPDRDGRMADVALGYPTLAGYLARSGYFGATVGRVANRIAGGRFTIDGKAYRVPVNNGANSLHGGTAGFDKRVWTIVSAQSGRVVLRLVSADGDQGCPGAATATASYSLDDAGQLAIEYTAVTDAPTIVNLSNHAYWNLGGEGSGSAMGHVLTIPADAYLPVDAGLIPTGEIRPVAGTPFDFRTPTPVGARIRDAGDAQIAIGRGYDHNWVLARTVSPLPRLVARVEEPVSGRVLEVFSDQPGLQFYSGNFLDGTVFGKSGRAYRQGDTVVLEPQMFADTPNQPAFGSVRLDPGQTYRSRIAFRFSVAAR